MNLTDYLIASPRQSPTEENLVDLLGMDRMIRRAFERATANDPAAVDRWHQMEVDAARRAAHARRNTNFRRPLRWDESDSPELG